MWRQWVKFGAHLDDATFEWSDGLQWRTTREKFLTVLINDICSTVARCHLNRRLFLAEPELSDERRKWNVLWLWRSIAVGNRVCCVWGSFCVHWTRNRAWNFQLITMRTEKMHLQWPDPSGSGLLVILSHNRNRLSNTTARKKKKLKNDKTAKTMKKQAASKLFMTWKMKTKIIVQLKGK